MVVLIVVLAAMFTITGAMIAITGRTGGPTAAGTLDGEEVGLVKMQRTRAALEYVANLDRYAGGSGATAKESLYARVPSLPARSEVPTEWPRETSLLEFWPSYQDQRSWCHIVLARKAKAAGFAPPSNNRIGAILTALMNARLDETEQFTQDRLKRKFKESFQWDLNDLWQTFQECLSVRDYVASLLAEEQATLVGIDAIAAGNRQELKAEYARLKIDPFLAEARRQVERENFAYRAAGHAGGIGPGTRGGGYDRFDEAFDKNSGTELEAEAVFEVDYMRVWIEDIQTVIPVEEALARTYYLAMKDELYKTPDNLKTDKKLTSRLNDIEVLKIRSLDAEGVKWDDGQWEKWRTETRKELESHRDFSEVNAELTVALRKDKGLKAAQMAISELLMKLREKQEERKKELDTLVQALEAERRVPEGLKSYREGLGSRFDSLVTQVFSNLRRVHEGMPASLGEDEIKRITRDVANALTNFSTQQMSTLLDSARQKLQDFEKQLDAEASVVGDLDADGDLDLVVRSMERPVESQLWLNVGAGSFLPLERIEGERVERVADLDHDGVADLVTTHRNQFYTYDDSMGVLRGSLSELSIPSYVDLTDLLFQNSVFPIDGILGGATFEDFNGDGFLDMGVVSWPGSTSLNSTATLYIDRQGFGETGYLANVAVHPALPLAADARLRAGDLDGDGAADVLISGIDGGPHISVMRAKYDDPSWFFEGRIQQIIPRGILADVDGDGDLDVVGGGVVFNLTTP